MNIKTLSTVAGIALAVGSVNAATLSVDLHGSVATGFTAWDALEVDNAANSSFHGATSDTSDTYLAVSTGFSSDISAVMTSSTTMSDLANRNNAPSEIYEDTVNASGASGMMTLTINGLVAGETYSLSVYALDSNGGTTSTAVREYTLTNGVAATVDNVQWSADDFTADYTFVADGTSVSVQNTAGTAQSAMNGFTLTSVPEPSSAALLGLGGLALIMRRRK